MANNALNFLFSRRGMALEPFAHNRLQPNLRPLRELLIRQSGRKERRFHPRKGKKFIVFGNGSRPNLPKSEYVLIEDPKIHALHCILRLDCRFGWRVEYFRWKGERRHPADAIEYPSPRRVKDGTIVQVGNASVIPMFGS